MLNMVDVTDINCTVEVKEIKYIVSMLYMINMIWINDVLGTFDYQ